MRAILGATTLLAALAFAATAQAADFTVTTTSDSGEGSLRQAIVNANGTLGADRIVFNIGLGGSQTITLAGQLPSVNEQTEIDGTTQGGWFGPPLIELSGNGVVAFGLDLAGANSIVRGLVVNRFTAVGVNLRSAGGIRLFNNYIGTNSSGTAALGNGIGVRVQAGAGTSIIGGTGTEEANVVSGNLQSGIQLLTSGPAVVGNRIGTNAAGDAAVGNAGDGISVAAGGATITSNVISGNGTDVNSHAGVNIAGSGTNVTANMIGTNAAGNAAIVPGSPKPIDGIKIEFGTGNVIGGDPGQGNVISGNQRGVVITGSGNVIRQNRIGTDASGTGSIPNGDTGVLLAVSASDNTIQSNRIGNNGGWGVYAFGGTGNAIRTNRIFSNGQLGIDLAPQNRTLNDAGDGDTGANNLQNFPVIASANVDGPTVFVTMTLNSTPNTTFAIDFFRGDCDPSGYGEGDLLYLPDSGTPMVITTDASGNGTLVFDTPLAGSRIYTATATDPSGNTSEFSECFRGPTEVIVVVNDTTITSAPVDYADSSSAAFSFTSSASSPSFECSLDGSAFAACTSPRSYVELSNGPHRFEVKDVTDSTPAVRRWTVDTVPSDGTLDQHNGRVTSTTGGSSIGGEVQNELAQIFSPGSPGALLEARIGLSCPISSSVRARIETTSGGVPTGTVLATADVTDAGPGVAFKRFPFSPAPDLVPGTDYALVLSGPLNIGCFAYIAEDALPGGMYFRAAAPTPGGWTLNSAPEDLAFATFMGEAVASLVVTNTNDAGAGSLRQAILTANTTEGADTITFAIPGSGPHTITLATALPAVTGATTIDGASQSGFIGSPLIELAGASGFGGLLLTGNGAVVRSLALYGFQNAVEITGSSNRLVGSYVGLDGAGVARGNANIGVIVGSGEGNEIGGAAAGDRNVISDNAGNGVIVSNAAGTSIRNNLIGVNALGSADMGNALNGILVNPGASGTSIVENVASGNGGDGVFVHSEATLLGNRIGIAAGSIADIGNTGDGVQLNGTGSDLGDGTSAGSNTIAENGGAGVHVSGSTANRISRNSIYANGGLEIDLAPLGSTPNDEGDGDSGANGLQNFPELQDVRLSDDVSIQGRLSSSPSTAFRLEFFASTTCGSGVGDARTFLGSTDVTTTPDGDAAFVATLPGVDVVVGGALTATATDPAGNTSELSVCRAVSASGSALGFDTPADCVPGYLGGHTVDFEDAPVTGSLAESYAALGLHFVDDESTTPIAYSNAGERLTSSPPTSLANDAQLGTSANVPLTMLFDEPQTRVGFFAGNGSPGTIAELTAYGSDSDVLGSVLVGVSTNDVATYIGVRNDDGGIRKVTLDYGDTLLSEEIDDVCFLAREEEGEESTAVTLTSDDESIVAGVKLVPLGDVPSNQLPSFAGAPSSTPVGSIPVGSIPVGSIPVGSIPVGSIPVGSIPVGSIPVGSIPVGSIPVGSIGLNSVPVGSIGLDQVLLSMLPVDATALLAGTPLANVPRQSITLADIYANATTRARFEALTLADSGLALSILGGTPFAAFLLGSARLSDLPSPGASTWCGAITQAGGSCSGVSGTNTVLGLSIAGIPVGSIPVGSIPVGSIPVGSIPVGSIPVGSIDLEASRLAGIPVGSISNPSLVLECGDSCPAGWELRDAKAAGAIKGSAQLKHLVGAFPNDLVLNDLMLGIVPRSALAWEGFPIDGFQLFAGTGDSVRYRLNFKLTCPAPANFSARVLLADGWLYKAGSTRWSYGDAAAVAGADPSTTSRSGARWTALPGAPCAGGASSQDVELSFAALSGLSVGMKEATGSVTMGATVLSTGAQAPVLVTQNWEANDDLAGGPVIEPNRLVVGHVANAGDREVFRLAIPSVRGTRTTIHVSHIAAGADFDLVVGKPGAEPLQSSPVGSIPVGSIPVEDGGSGTDNRTDALPPETLQDVPVGSIPVGSISANRGNANEVAQLVADGEEGFYSIVVSGYNGSHSDEPFVLRVVQTPPPTLPPCPARAIPAAAAGTLPAGVAPGTETLFVVNKQRLSGLYGAATTETMISAAAAVASRAEVNGAVLEVDGDPAVRAAYAQWDANPCSIDAANDVVRAINAVVAGYRATAGIKYVALLGTDEAIPMMRRLDPVTISNETDEAADLLFTTEGGTRANALFAAASFGYFLSDTVYGAFTSIPWLGRDLYLPDVAVGRLVETPTDIERQLLLYVAANGVLTTGSSLTTAYDFLTDGGEAVAAGLAPFGGPSTLINDTWSATDLGTAFTSNPDPADILSVNAHYSHWLLQPAAGSTLVTTGNLPALPSDPDVEPTFAHRVLFTMGCHAGLNVADTLVSSPTAFQAARLRDWTQSLAQQRSAVYVANTGFGYGDTVANALSERLMSIFADKLGDGGAIGDRWTDAVQEYFGTAGLYGVYDEKALTEATFYGLPFWSLGPAVAPSTSAASATSAAGALTVESITVTPSLVERQTPRGRFWEAQDGTLAIHYRPIQPRVAVDVTRPGLVATGAIIRSLTTQDVGNVDPVHATPTIDLGANEPERRFRQLIFPANVVALTRSRGGGRQHAVVIAGQFRPGDSAAAGTQRLVRQIGLDVAYVGSPTDSTAPNVEQVSAVQLGGSATIVVRANEDAPGGVTRIAALYTDGSGGSGGTIAWQFVELTPGADGWSANVPASGPIQVVAMAQNANGLVGYSANKGVNFPSVTDTSDPDVLLESPAPGAVYLLNERVPVSFKCSDAGVVASCVGAPLTSDGLLDTSQPGERTFTVTANDLSGRETVLSVPYKVHYVFTGFFAPIENPPTLNAGIAGRTYPVKWRLTDANGAVVSTLAAVRSISRVALASCANRPQDPAEAGDPVSTSALRFDAASGQYLYNWKTEKSDAGCRRLVVELADGTRRSADFLLR